MVERLDTKISKGVLASGTKASGGQMGGGGYGSIRNIDCYERVGAGKRSACSSRCHRPVSALWRELQLLFHQLSLVKILLWNLKPCTWL